VAFRPDGTILAVGTAMTALQTPTGVDYGPELVLAHYDTAGRRDQAFGSGGTATILAGTYSTGASIALRPDGKIVVGGDAWNGGPPPDALLARFNADGSLDNTFAGGGYFTTHLDDPSSYDHFYSVALQNDGSIVAGAFTSLSGPMLLRYHEDGAPDASFGSGGRVALPFFNGVILQADGKIVVTGSVNNNLGAARYLASAPQVSSFTASPASAPAGADVTLAAGVLPGNPGPLGAVTRWPSTPTATTTACSTRRWTRCWATPATTPAPASGS